MTHIPPSCINRYETEWLIETAQCDVLGEPSRDVVTGTSIRAHVYLDYDRFLEICPYSHSHIGSMFTFNAGLNGEFVGRAINITVYPGNNEVHLLLSGGYVKQGEDKAEDPDDAVTSPLFGEAVRVIDIG